jgi:hypothetical protein
MSNKKETIMKRFGVALLAAMGLFACGDAYGADIYEGVSVVQDESRDPCYVKVERSGTGDISAITVTGLSTQSTFFKETTVATYIEVRDELPMEGWNGFTSFDRVPSVSHWGFTRVALLRRWGNEDNPWPGLSESRYVVERGDFSEVIASDRISVLTDLATFSRSKIHCRDLVLSP